MLSIGQFSKICMASIKTLHHYDKIKLLSPDHVDVFTGYRYYNEEQIPAMLLIQRLKRYGFSLSDIKVMISCEDKGVLHSKLAKQKENLRGQLEETSVVIKEIETHLTDFERTGNIMGYQNNYDVELKNTQDIAILSTRQNMGLEDFGKYFGNLFEKIAREKIKTSMRGIAIYHDKEFDPENSDIEVAVEITETKDATRVIKGGLCAHTVHYGGYSDLNNAYGTLVKWIGNNGYQVADAPYEIYIKTQFQNVPMEEWITEIYFPIKK